MDDELSWTPLKIMKGLWYSDNQKHNIIWL